MIDSMIGLADWKVEIASDLDSLPGGVPADVFIRVRVRAPSPDGHVEGAARSLAIALDRSGSMKGEKIALAKEAIFQCLDAMDDRDQFAIVAYDDEIDVVHPISSASKDNVRMAKSAVESIRARGQTDIAQGWLRACEQIGDHSLRDTAQRAIVISDGNANAGIVDPEEICHHAEQLAKRGLSTSTIGLGEDFDEFLLVGMASAGEGNAYYVSEAEDLPRVLGREARLAAEVAARRARIAIKSSPSIELEPLGDHKCLRAKSQCKFDLGDIVARQVITITLRATVSPTKAGRNPSVSASLSLDTTPKPGQIVARLSWNRRNENDSLATVGGEIRRGAAELLLEAARLKALSLNRRGLRDSAAEHLLAVAAEIGDFDSAGDCVTVRKRALADANRFRLGVSPENAKELQFRSSATLRGRGPDGAPEQG